MPTPFLLPFIRWADSVVFPPAGFGATNRRLYDHEFVYVQEGVGFVTLDGIRFRAQADDLFLVQPGVWHSFRAAPDAAMRVIGVHFDWVPRPDTESFQRFFAVTEPQRASLFRTREAVPGWDLRATPCLRLQGRPRVRQVLETVCAEYARLDDEAQSMAGAYLAVAIFQMQREARLQLEQVANPGVGPDAMRRVQRARELLEFVSDEPLTIEVVASRVGWTSDHLRRMFRSVLATTPLALQTAARLRRAQELLRYGGLSVAEIGARCGFKDSSHFSRVFKAEMGYTPREWVALTLDRGTDGA